MNLRTWILVLAAAVALAAQTSDADVTLQRAMRKESVEGDLKGAIDLYKKVITGAGKNRAAAAKALLRLGDCYEKQGSAEARQAYERLVKDFSDQKQQAHDASARLAAMGATPGGAKSTVAQLITSSKVGLGIPNSRVTPDGRYIPMSDLETGDLALRDLQTGEIKRLTHEGTATPRFSHARYPVPSRNGKQIAFVWYFSDERKELRVINLDGTGMRTVPLKIGDREEVDICDWSPDGKSVLADWYADESPYHGFATIDLGTGERRQFVPQPSGSTDVAGYSPDGRWIVFARQPDYRKPDWDIFAYDTQTRLETAVVTGAGADRLPVWVPDTDTILFRSDRSGKDGVWLVRFQNGQASDAPVLIKPDAGEYTPRGASRDGSLFYVVRQQAHNVYQVSVDPVTLRAQGAPARVIDTYLGHNYSPSWSPTGVEIAYSSERGNDSQVVVRHPDGKETLVARTEGYPLGAPHWCGSGDRLVQWGIPGPLEGRFFDARTGIASGSDVQIKPPGGSYQLGYSPDCQSAYISSYVGASKRRRIYRYDFPTGTETDVLIDGGEWAYNPVVSPDGRWLALHGKLESGGRQGLLLLATAGGPLRMLDPDAQFGHSWSPDSKHLIYTRKAQGPGIAAPTNEGELYSIAVDGGAPQSMGIRMALTSGASLNPDGRRLLFSGAETSNEFWALRNLPLPQGAQPQSVQTGAARLIRDGRWRDMGVRITPDGRLLPFAETQTSGISVRDLRTGEVRRVIGDGTPWEPGKPASAKPVVSRDGSQIAYTWYPGIHSAELRVANMDGSGMRTVPLRGQDNITVWDWAPDGKIVVAFLTGPSGGWQGMATVDLATGDAHRLMECGGITEKPCTTEADLDVAGFSPDGRWIVYARRVIPGFTRDLFAMELQAGKETALLHGPGQNAQPMWVPGSDKIVFQSDRNGKNGIWMVTFQTGWTAGAPVLLKHDVENFLPKGVSRDGSLFYAINRGANEIYQATVDPQTLRAVDTPQRVPGIQPGNNIKPLWSPDGASLVWLSRRAEGNERPQWRAVVRHSDGKEVVTPQVPGNYPAWCQSGDRIYVEPSGFYDARTGKLVQRGIDGVRAVSGDCKSVAYASRTDRREGIFKIDLGTLKEVKLAPTAGIWSLSLSPDGRWLVYRGSPLGTPGAGLLLLSTEGGEPRVLDGDASANDWFVTWTPDSRRVFYTRAVYRFNYEELYTVAVDGGAPQSMGVRMPHASGASLHPDGKRIVFSGGDAMQQLWVLPSLPLN